jgi:hypothetical protein
MFAYSHLDVFERLARGGWRGWRRFSTSFNETSQNISINKETRFETVDVHEGSKV